MLKIKLTVFAEIPASVEADGLLLNVTKADGTVESFTGTTEASVEDARNRVQAYIDGGGTTEVIIDDL